VDDATLQFYRQNAEAYAQREITSRYARLGKFLALLPPGAAILELGCGAGADSAEMLARGFDVTPTDGSPEMAEVASRRLGRPVRTLLFHDMDGVEAYDGIWANACLLHVPRDQLASILALIRSAEAGRRILRELQSRRWRRARHAQSLLQLSDGRLAARHLRAGRRMD
jgi:2-polyprenyl-3-methyl-5-hydroxy-6-metoxy-1,4-benzoquinol methylase